jgi:hypothetical protein
VVALGRRLTVDHGGLHPVGPWPDPAHRTCHLPPRTRAIAATTRPRATRATRCSSSPAPGAQRGAITRRAVAFVARAPRPGRARGGQRATGRRPATPPRSAPRARGAAEAGGDGVRMRTVGALGRARVRGAGDGCKHVAPRGRLIGFPTASRPRPSLVRVDDGPARLGKGRPPAVVDLGVDGVRQPLPARRRAGSAARPSSALAGPRPRSRRRCGARRCGCRGPQRVVRAAFSPGSVTSSAAARITRTVASASTRRSVSTTGPRAVFTRIADGFIDRSAPRR